MTTITADTAPDFITNFVRDAERRAAMSKARAEPVQRPTPVPAVEGPAPTDNPFTMTAREAQAIWNDMVDRVDQAEKTAAEYRDQTIWLSGEVDRLTRELNASEIKLAVAQGQAQAAHERWSNLHSRFGVIRGAIDIVLRVEDGEQPPLPEQPAPVHVHPTVTAPAVPNDEARAPTSDKIPVNRY